MTKGIGHPHKGANATKELFATLDTVGFIPLRGTTGGGPLFGYGVGVGNNALQQCGALAGRGGGPGQGLVGDVSNGRVQGGGVDGAVILVT